MDFIHSDFGQCRQGDLVEVTLTAWANVRLLDHSNFSRYQRGQQHRYFGGLAKQSPVRLAIPRAGHWHVAVDTQGLRNGTRASARLIPGPALRPLPPIREQHSSLASIAENLAAATRDEPADDREFDVFISHASEDKERVVRPLAEALRKQGLEVWYDEFELRVGDSLRRKIDSGIARSRFGLVVLSHAFFAKNWTQYELDGLVTMSVNGNQVLLPIWHEISKDDVIKQSPSLGDKVALRTSDYGIEEIATEIAAVISERK
jgi:Domain of unknown function (DUF1883)/TIR domain